MAGEQAVNFETFQSEVDLDLDPVDELQKFLDGDFGGKDDPPVAEEKKAEEEPKKVEEEEEPKKVEEEEPKKVEEEEPKKVEEEEPKKVDESAKILEELQSERKRLQDQLTELSVTSLADRRKLKELEEAIAKKQEPAEPEPEKGPTAEEILQQVDIRIAQVEEALAKAEAEDPSTAPALRRELRQLERAYLNVQQQAQQAAIQEARVDPGEVAQQAAFEAQQQTRFDQVRVAVKQEYPILDPDSEHFNEKLRDEVHALYNPMLQSGYDPTDALVKATTYVMRSNSIPSVSEYMKQKEEGDIKAKEEEAKKKEEEDKKKKIEEDLEANKRKQEAVERNIKAAEASSPDLSGTGTSNTGGGILDKYDFNKMSIKEFAKLTDDEAQTEMIENALRMYDEPQ